jgi:hypothetical protein
VGRVHCILSTEPSCPDSEKFRAINALIFSSCCWYTGAVQLASINSLSAGSSSVLETAQGGENSRYRDDFKEESERAQRTRHTETPPSSYQTSPNSRRQSSHSHRDDRTQDNEYASHRQPEPASRHQLVRREQDCDLVVAEKGLTVRKIDVMQSVEKNTMTRIVLRVGQRIKVNTSADLSTLNHLAEVLIMNGWSALHTI